MAKFQFVSIYVAPFSRYRFFENRNAHNDTRMTFITEASKVPCVHWICTSEAQISIRFALRPAVFEIQGFLNTEMHPMTPEWPKVLRCQRYPVYTEHLPRGPNFNPLRSTTNLFEIQSCRKSECNEWPQNDLNHWSVKSTLCTVNTHNWGPNFNPFRSTTRGFWDTGFSKIEMNPMTPEWT